ncbi:hypothetical protein CCYA_CCYA02G0601 [Cyanidiococcus yangmingshanensis]|nr:hypothetical protein CCYA_CCYA02G0601 [Cyanidiococcus yangmingshanensis]
MPVSLKRLQARQEKVTSGIEKRSALATRKVASAKRTQVPKLNPYLVGFLLFIVVGGALFPHVQRFILGVFS